MTISGIESLVASMCVERRHSGWRALKHAGDLLSARADFHLWYIRVVVDRIPWREVRDTVVRLDEADDRCVKSWNSHLATDANELTAAQYESLCEDLRVSAETYRSVLSDLCQQFGDELRPLQLD